MMQGTPPPILGVLNVMAMTVCCHLALPALFRLSRATKNAILLGGYTVTRILCRLHEKKGNLGVRDPTLT